MRRSDRPLRVLTWQVHGNYLYYLTHAPHEFHVLSRPGRPPGYGGRGGALPWGANVHDLPCEDLPGREFDCVLYQSRQHYLEDRQTLLTPAQRRLPQIYLEHDPPQEHPTDTPHPAAADAALIVHVTHYNALMWDNGAAPARVIEHGVAVPEGIRHTGELARGIVVINHLARRGRRLGADVFEAARRRVPLDLVGMDAERAGGLGEIPNLALPAFMARYRFFFSPVRYTSLALAAIEAMMAGLPVVGLATTEHARLVDNGVEGYVANDLEELVAVMQRLLDDASLAARWGARAQARARTRFGIRRFAADWDAALRAAVAA